VHRVMIMGIGITCLEHSSGPVNCTTAKTMLAYSSSSPRTRTRVDWRYFDSCRIGLIESKPSNCEAPDASIGAYLHAVSKKIFSTERLIRIPGHPVLLTMDLPSYLTYGIRTGLLLPCFGNDKMKSIDSSK
jgi:hypothetical protein